MHLLQYATAVALVISGGGLVYHSVRMAQVAEAWERQARALARRLRAARPDAKTEVAPHLHAPRRFD